MFELVDDAGNVLNVVDLPDVLLACGWFFQGKDYTLISATADEATVLSDNRRWLVRRTASQDR